MGLDFFFKTALQPLNSEHVYLVAYSHVIMINWSEIKEKIPLVAENNEVQNSKYKVFKWAFSQKYFLSSLTASLLLF